MSQRRHLHEESCDQGHQRVDMPEARGERPVVSAIPTARYAWRVAAPLDFAINLAINGVIAAWLFRGLSRVPITAGLSVTSMVVPMSFLLCSITTVFGWYNAVRERRRGRVTPPIAPGVGWFGRAVLDATGAGFVGLAAAWLAAAAAGRSFPAATVSYATAVAGIGLLAGMLGYIFHGRAVQRAGRHATSAVPASTPRCRLRAT